MSFMGSATASEIPLRGNGLGSWPSQASFLQDQMCQHGCAGTSGNARHRRLADDAGRSIERRIEEPWNPTGSFSSSRFGVPSCVCRLPRG